MISFIHMSTHLEVIIGNHQEFTEVPVSWLTALEHVAEEAAVLALAHASGNDTPLHHLATLEVALVSDDTSDRVHREFMDIEGATDVITFHHGEIVIGAQVAERQAAEYGEPLARELLRYLVHGLLHLAGHDDSNAVGRAAMEAAQEQIVSQLWLNGLHVRIGQACG
jgi:probable rRNA maturation factor